MEMKASIAATRTFKALPKDKQEVFAKALTDIMNGRPPAMKPKPLKGLGKNKTGVLELKINGSPAYRVVYVIKAGVLYLLHAFTKTTNGVDKRAMDTVVKRYKEIPI
jgi:phage-related protein